VNGEIYVANSGLGIGPGIVDAISGSTNTIVAAIPVGTDPMALVTDSTDGDVYAANENSNGSGTIYRISGSTDKVEGAALVGASPVALAFDSANREVFVANLGSNSVSVVAPSAFAPPSTTVTSTTPEFLSGALPVVAAVALALAALVARRVSSRRFGSTSRSKHLPSK